MPPLLLIHGMWARPSVFAALRAELAAAGFRTAAPALPFHAVPPGAPAPPELGALRLEDYVAALVPEVAALGGRPVILGHSLGGLLAQLLAARTGAAGLILIAPAPSAQTLRPSLAQLRTLARVTRGWGWWRRPTLLDAGSARWGVFNGVPEAEARAALAELTWDSGPVLAQISAPVLDRRGGARVDYARLAMPALLIFGSMDRIATAATARATARRLPGRVEYEEWPDCGHWVFHDAIRPRLAQRIAAFVAGLPPGD